MVHRGDESAAGSEHAGDFPQRACHVGHERQPAERRAGHVGAAVKEGQRADVGLHQRDGDARGPVQLRRAGQHPRGDVEGHDVRPGPSQPAGAGRRAAADLDDPAPRHVAEQVRIGLPEPLGPPEEVGVTEIGAVFREVRRRGSVPPSAVRAGGFLDSGRPAGDAACCGIAVTAEGKAGERGRRDAHDAPIVTRRKGSDRPRTQVDPAVSTSVRWGVRQRSVVVFRTRNARTGSPR
jgi:hypothetical protein